MPQTVVTIPWRPTPERQPWYDAVLKHYSTHFPDWDVLPVDSGHDDFNRAASRNLGVREAESRGADVVVINDADVLAKSSSIRAAVTAAHRDGGLHFPFEGCQVKTGEHARQFVKNVVFPDSAAFPSTGGIYVIRPDQWQQIGGADEGFLGWGVEDDATTAAADTLIGIHRHPGTAVSLGHREQRLTNPHYPWNVWRGRQYEQARGDEEAMRDLIANRDQIAARASRHRGIAVVVPSRGRPDNLTRLRDAIRDTAATDVTILAGLDEDDAHQYPQLTDVEYTVRPRQRLNAWWNQLALDNADRFDTFVFLGDDNAPITPGWDLLLDEELRTHDDVGFACGPDGLRRDRKFTWAALSSRQIRALGYVGPPGLQHLYIDTAWQSLADATDTKYWLDHVTIDHLHYSRPGANVPRDKTYAEANATEVNAADQETHRAWTKSDAFTDAVATIRRLQETPWTRPNRATPTATGRGVTMPFAVTIDGETVHTGTLDVPVTARLERGRVVLDTPTDLLTMVREAL